jgi:hypothetical protein
METNNIVVCDITGKYAEGTLVDDATARVMRLDRSAVLSVVAENLNAGGVSAYMRRGLGAGVELDPAYPRRVCPMLLHVTSGIGKVHWTARLMARGGRPPSSGQIRLIADNQPGTSVGGLSAVENAHVDLAKLREPDALGGWNVGGSTTVNFSGSGFLSLALHGMGAGIVVMWGAVTQGRLRQERWTITRVLVGDRYHAIPPRVPSVNGRCSHVPSAVL